MKKSDILKKITLKKNEHEWISFFQDKFIMVAYSDLKLVPNQALLLGYIRGMITTNKKSKRAAMKMLDRYWMKDSMKKMAYLIGVSESTIKDYISILLKKQYISQGNFSSYQDNTNWYTINQDKIDSDFKVYLHNQIEDLKTLEQEQEINLTLIESNECKVEFTELSSQKLPIDTVEIAETLLYNNIKSDYNTLESNKNLLESNENYQSENLENEYYKIKDVEDIKIHLSVLKSFNLDKISKSVKLIFLNKYLDQNIENIKSKNDVMENYYKFKVKLQFEFKLDNDDLNYCLRLFDLYFEQETNLNLRSKKVTN